MRTDSLDDPWMLPSRQGDHPSRPVIPEEKLHRRREGVFLVLASLFMIAIAMLQLTASNLVIDVSYTLSTLVPDLAFPTALALLFAAIAFPISFVAINLVCELYGKRRAWALITVGVVATLALVAVTRLAGQLDGDPMVVRTALALAGCDLVAHVVNLGVFEALRRRMRGRGAWLRQLVSTTLAQGFGWATFALMIYDQAPADSIAVAAGSALYVVAFSAAIVIPFAIVTASLTRYLRIDVASEDDEPLDEAERFWADPAPRRRLPPALIIEDADSAPVRSPFTSAEMRFFTEGEQLAESTQPR